MTRTITVTGGFSGAVTVDLVDSLRQLAAASFKVALCPVGQDDPPVVDALTWKTATGTVTAGNATVSATYDGTQALGDYNIAVDIIRDGAHEAHWVADKRNPRARALVIVT